MMRQDQPFLTEAARFQSLQVLSGQLHSATDLFHLMIGSSRNVVGADFIMVDESCGEVARLMNDCCAQIAGRMEELGSPDDRPVLGVRGLGFDDEDPEPLADGPEDLVFAVILDAFGQSVLDAVSLTFEQGDQPTAELLTRLWRDIELQLWRSPPQSAARQIIHLII